MGVKRPGPVAAGTTDRGGGQGAWTQSWHRACLPGEHAGVLLSFFFFSRSAGQERTTVSALLSIRGWVESGPSPASSPYGLGRGRTECISFTQPRIPFSKPRVGL